MNFKRFITYITLALILLGLLLCDGARTNGADLSVNDSFNIQTEEDLREFIREQMKEAVIYKSQCEVLSTIECYDRVLAVDPDNFSVLMLKASELALIDDYENALECYNRAIKIDNSNTYAIKRREKVLALLKNFK